MTLLVLKFYTSSSLNSRHQEHTFFVTINIGLQLMSFIDFYQHICPEQRPHDLCLDDLLTDFARTKSFYLDLRLWQILLKIGP